MSLPAVKIFQGTPEGGPVIVPHQEHLPPDVGAAKLWLSRRQPDLWRERRQVDVSGSLEHRLNQMTPEERDSFLAIASGFHHGERQVEVELPTFMLGASEEEKIYITSQIEDEARHTVFFDRFYREVVGLEGSTIMEVLDNSYQWVSEVFVGPFGLLAYLADAVRNNPEPYRDREQIEKVRQLDPLEFLRAVGAAGARTICARAVGANRPAVRLTSLL